MKLLFVENISYRIVKKIIEIYPSSLHVSTVRPVIEKDKTIFEYARKEGFIIVTFDEDFREIQSLEGNVIKLRAIDGLKPFLKSRF